MLCCVKLDCIDIDLTYLFANMNMWQKEVLGPFISQTSGCAVNILELEKSKKDPETTTLYLILWCIDQKCETEFLVI